MKDYSTDQNKLNKRAIEPNPKKSKYRINLDLGRVLWLIALSCFILTFSFLFGYWVSSQKQDYLKLKRMPTLPEDAVLDKLSEDKMQLSLKRVEALTEKVLQQEKLISKKVKPSKLKVKATVKKKLTPKKTKKLNQKPKNKQYIIQVSAHHKKNNAIRLQTALKKQGYQVYLSKKVKANQLIYLVQVGPFSSKEKATKIRASLVRFKETKRSFIILK